MHRVASPSIFKFTQWIYEKPYDPRMQEKMTHVPLDKLAVNPIKICHVYLSFIVGTSELHQQNSEDRYHLGAISLYIKSEHLAIAR